MMKDPFELFSTDLQVNPDWNQADLQTAVAEHIQHQKAIEGLLRGEVAPDTVGDMLAEHGIEPTEWLAASLDNWYEDLESGLVVPGASIGF